jgi:hypothetical protein
MKKRPIPKPQKVDRTLTILIAGVALTLCAAGIQIRFDKDSQVVNASQRASTTKVELGETAIRGQQDEGAGASQPGRAAAPGQAGQRVYIDPTTGRFIEPPPDVQAAEALATQADPLTLEMSTSDVGLVETPLAGGGSTVDLQGRFRNALVATVGSDGKVTIGHLPIKPAPQDKK